MKPPIATSLFAVVLLAGACSSAEREATHIDATAAYDSVLATRLGADDYGMRRYVMAFLRAGPNRDTTGIRELQRGHLDNIQRLADEGKLLLAGPFLDGDPVRGIFVFDVETVDEARTLTETDPAIQAGRLDVEYRPWYGPAALKEVGPISDRITRQSP